MSRMESIALRNEVTDLLSRYAHAIDAGDVDGVLRCLSADVLLEYESGTIRLRGHAEARELYERTLAGPSTHLLSNILVESTGDAAIARSAAIVCVARQAGMITVRGVQYTFHCRQSDADWQISHLEHRPQWQFTVPGELLSRQLEASSSNSALP